MRRIGEEVPSEDGGEYGRKFKEIPISTEWNHIVLSRLYVILLAFGVGFVVICLIIIPFVTIDPLGGISIFIALF